ncbi:hypothetical protein G7054_g1627 [Neopestalotiopsis clavispora]|nr:hypothetical protein G7054_g1627 [Neopestalotiopsis clavispora]
MRENAFSIHGGNTNDAGHLLRARDSIDPYAIYDTYEHYGQHVELYSQRILTYPSDIYHAFHGIENALYPDGGVLYGLPESDFNRALLWYPDDRLRLRERQCDKQDTILPSWSWASLEGCISTNSVYGFYRFRARQCGSFYCSLSQWDTWDGNQNTEGSRRIDSVNDQIVWAKLDEIWSESNRHMALGPSDSFRGSPDYRQFVAMAWSKGCIEADVPADLINPESDAMSAENLESRWPTMKKFSIEVQQKTHRAANLLDCPKLNPGYLSTRAQWSVLSVKHECIGGSRKGNFLIRIASSENNGKAIGALLGTVEYRLRGTVPSCGAADVDFLALAVGAMPVRLARYSDQEILERNCFHRDHPNHANGWGQPGVAVMAVRWTDSVARRLALGWVTLQGWVDSRPKFRTVVLA